MASAAKPPRRWRALLGAEPPRFAGFPENRSDTVGLGEVVAVIERTVAELQAGDRLCQPRRQSQHRPSDGVPRRGHRAASHAGRIGGGFLRLRDSFEHGLGTAGHGRGLSPDALRRHFRAARAQDAGTRSFMPSTCGPSRTRAPWLRSRTSRVAAAPASALPPPRPSPSCARSTACRLYQTAQAGVGDQRDGGTVADRSIEH